MLSRRASTAFRANAGPTPGSELRRAKARDRIGRVLRPAQEREQILDVRGLEELQAAVLHVRNAAAAELELEQIRVMSGAHQHGLIAQLQAGLAIREHVLDHVVDLGELVVDDRENRPLAGAAAYGVQVLRVALRATLRSPRSPRRRSAVVER